jgi:hypothetical protein
MRVDPYLISPSRFAAYAECGVKFRFRYVDEIRSPYRSSRLLYGSVLHRARELWRLDPSLDMTALVAQAWQEQAALDAPLARFLGAYAALSEQARELEDEILERRPDIVRPRQTKDFLSSPLATEITVLLLDLTKRLEGSIWQFTKTDPLPRLYDESLRWAPRYQQRWAGLQPAYMVEVGFSVAFGEFTLTGRMDEVAEVVTPDGELCNAVVDAKNYAEDPFAPRFMDQGAIYYLAFLELCRQGRFPELDPARPFRFGVDELRLYRYRWFRIGERQVRMLKVALEQYARGVQSEVYLPAAARCSYDLCDFRQTCEHYFGADEDFELNDAYNPDEVTTEEEEEEVQHVGA